MNNTIAGLPYQWIEFSKKGELKGSPPVIPNGTTDVIIISHGWKTDRDSAPRQYTPLIENIVEAWEAGKPSKPAARRFAVLGVLWPSKAFDSNYEMPEEARNADGAAMSAETGDAQRDLPSAELAKQVTEFAELADIDPADLQRRVNDALQEGFESSAAVALMEHLSAALEPAADNDSEIERDGRPFKAEKAGSTLSALTQPQQFEVITSVGSAKNIEDKVKSLFAGPKSAISRLLNQLTFYTMKKRAGVVGAGLAGSVLKQLRNMQSVQRVHLIGHSFGARVVTAAAFASGPEDKLSSMSLLQGAFSHNALSSANGGVYKEAYDRISGPVLITHTHNDGAVTLAYAIASRLARDNSKAIGDASDEFGAMGANGALALRAGIEEKPLHSAEPLGLKAGKVHNIKCDEIIKDHMDVVNVSVARLVANALVF